MTLDSVEPLHAPILLPRPIPNSYWVVPGRLLAGEYPRDLDEASSLHKMAALLERGITSFVDLTEAHEGLFPYNKLISGRCHKRFPIRDGSVPRDHRSAVAVLDHIDREIAEGQMVYVHCWGGIGRTGLIVGCWLARHGAGGQHGLQQLQEKWCQCAKSERRTSPETDEQTQFILSWRPGQ